MTQYKKRHSNRRNMLKKLSTGVVGFSLMTGATAAEQAENNLTVSVVPGEGDPFTERSGDVINDRFKARINVSGLSSGDSDVAYMLVPTGPERNFNPDLVFASAVEVDGSSVVITSSPPTWDPSGVIGPIWVWPNGTYHIYVTVAEAGQNNFGSSISESFEIRT